MDRQSACALVAASFVVPGAPASLLPAPPPTVTGAIATIAGGASAAKIVIPGASSAPATLTSSETALVVNLNEVRRLRCEAPLVVSGELARAAEAHALSMARRGYFSHSSPDGTPFWRRIARYYPIAGAARWQVGENLYWTTASPGASTITAAWLGSPEHRRIVFGRWAEAGLAIVRAAHAAGVFGGRDVVIVVADFGARNAA
jgi:uncharacterized protein YkwD